jgi:hypothetical protein
MYICMYIYIYRYECIHKHASPQRCSASGLCKLAAAMATTVTMYRHMERGNTDTPLTGWSHVDIMLKLTRMLPETSRLKPVSYVARQWTRPHVISMCCTTHGTSSYVGWPLAMIATIEACWSNREHKVLNNSMYMYIYIYVYMYTHIYVYVYTQQHDDYNRVPTTVNGWSRITSSDNTNTYCNARVVVSNPDQHIQSVADSKPQTITSVKQIYQHISYDDSPSGVCNTMHMMIVSVVVVHACTNGMIVVVVCCWMFWLCWCVWWVVHVCGPL